jgi:hypothetical protein
MKCEVQEENVLPLNSKSDRERERERERCYMVEEEENSRRELDW